MPMLGNALSLFIGYYLYSSTISEMNILFKSGELYSRKHKRHTSKRKRNTRIGNFHSPNKNLKIVVVVVVVVVKLQQV